MEKKFIYHPSIIWIIVGAYCIYTGLCGYYNYSQPRLWSFMTLNVLYIRDIVFGFLSIWVGMKLWPRPSRENNILDAHENASVFKTIKWVYAYPIWIIGLIIVGTIIISIRYFSIELDFLFTTDYLFLFLAYYSIITRTDKTFVNMADIIQFARNNYPFLLVGMIVLLGLIFGGAELLPYELFHWIHD